MICAPLAEERKCPPAEIVFVQDGAKAFYRVATCAGPDGKPVELQEGKIYRWLVSPLDAAVVFVSDELGRYLGKCEQAEAVDRGDDEAVKARITETRKAFEAALAPQRRRNTKKALALAGDMARNTRLLQEGRAGSPLPAAGKRPCLPAAAIEEARRINAAPPLDAARQQAVDEITLDDLSGASAPDHDDDEHFSGLDDLL
jgi:hypothetical protein